MKIKIEIDKQELARVMANHTAGGNNMKYRKIRENDILKHENEALREQLQKYRQLWSRISLVVSILAFIFSSICIVIQLI